MSGVNGTDAVTGGHGGENHVNSNSETQFNGQSVDDALGGGTQELGEQYKMGGSEGAAAGEQLAQKITDAVDQAIADALKKQEETGEQPPAGQPATGSKEDKESKIEELIKALMKELGLDSKQAGNLEQDSKSKSSESASTSVPETAEV
jgi:hypothetical protein